MHAYLGTPRENAQDIPLEARCEIARNRQSQKTTEQRSEIARMRYENKSDEERRQFALSGNTSLTPDQRSDRARRSSATKTPDERSDSARKREANKSPEKRLESSRKANITRQRGVQLIDSDGEVFIFESLSLASDVLNLSSKRLGEVCQGKRKSTHGYTATYWEG